MTDQHSSERPSPLELDFVSRWKQLVDRAGGQARIANRLGWTTSTASRDYNGGTLPSDERLAQLCQLLDMPHKDMLDLARLLKQARTTRKTRRKAKTAHAAHAAPAPYGPDLAAQARRGTAASPHNDLDS